MGVISILSSIKGPYIDAVGLGKESYHINAHFFLFVALCISYYYATGKVALSVVLTIIFGIFDELHQIFTPFRNASLFDIQVDSLGAVIGGIISWKFWPKIQNKLKNLQKK
ncbi:MAG: hypothetical protein UV00_C0005G0050 [candidate division WWE3 bacterium GW2011_GWF1_42_14]|uniref:VanZ-like domain-containing protein n=2 Tax=Katanobacteria TaxID=422282 RepID=A0A0G0YQC0_UNCKA|nr:MAG: hypothetical protein UU92_C0006G0008 [candidate division WWE3 bacterium GW2011_GWA1_42_12]KKS33578.1 MAG: hypothetical protein UU97_C0026G0008 [candidate division WWE3 bacterium GW2011_GWD1_42_14]KKS38867.1 MAG: hypothetical protein UV00_C0005G0050 [candidate division WWE3 bacterium GW2011_GWF1_42_14]KKS40565.1 MAG: hypothetical protein UV03_C0005G0051 [candidate division WWE3 bacterium GW2011_GWE1_42_16]KKS66927.1 MAG: hypothetical protein UV35_C0005G0008 [candidate division WWE3 bacte